MNQQNSSQLDSYNKEIDQTNTFQLTESILQKQQTQGQVNQESKEKKVNKQQIKNQQIIENRIVQEKSISQLKKQSKEQNKIQILSNFSRTNPKEQNNKKIKKLQQLCDYYKDQLSLQQQCSSKQLSKLKKENQDFKKQINYLKKMQSTIFQRANNYQINLRQINQALLQTYPINQQNTQQQLNDSNKQPKKHQQKIIEEIVKEVTKSSQNIQLLKEQVEKFKLQITNNSQLVHNLNKEIIQSKHIITQKQILLFNVNNENRNLKQQLANEKQINQSRNQQIWNLKSQKSKLQQIKQKLFLTIQQQFSAILQNNQNIDINQQKTINFLSTYLTKIQNQHYSLRNQLIQTKLNYSLFKDKNSLALDLKNIQIQILSNSLLTKESQINNLKAELNRLKKQNEIKITYLLQKSQSLINQNTIYLSKLIQSKQLDWNKSKQIFQQRLTQFDLIIQINKQLNYQQLLKQNDKYNSKQQEFKQLKELLAKCQTQNMDLNQILDQNREIIYQLSEKLDLQTKKRQQFKSFIRCINLKSELHKIIEQLNKNNKNHQFDQVILTFEQLQGIIDVQNYQIQENKQKINKLMSIKTYQQEYHKQLQLQIQLQHNIKQLKQKHAKEINIFTQQKDQKIRQLKTWLQSQKQINKQLKQSKIKLSEQLSLVTQQLIQLKTTTQSTILKYNQTSKIENNKLTENIIKLQRQLDQQIEESKQLKQTINSLNQQINKLKEETIVLQSQQKFKTLQIKKQTVCEIQQKGVSQKQFQSLRKKYLDIQKQLQESNQISKQFQILYDTASSDNKILQQELNQLKQNYKQGPKITQQKEKNAIITNRLFIMPSIIEDDQDGKDYLLSVLDKYCNKAIKDIHMVFKMDDNNKNNFHYTFKQENLNNGIFCFLFKRKQTMFGFLTFSKINNQTPAASIIVSISNRRSVFKLQQNYDVSAFKYEYNSITFGGNEIKIKSGYKNLSISEFSLRKYFAKYNKNEIFGPDTKDVIDFRQFQIHRIII